PTAWNDRHGPHRRRRPAPHRGRSDRGRRLRRCEADGVRRRLEGALLPAARRARRQPGRSGSDRGRARARCARRHDGGCDPSLRRAAARGRRRRAGLMVARLVDAALRHRLVVYLLATATLAAGFYTILAAPLDVFPEFAPPIVEIQTEAPALAAADVEALVTTP